MPRMVKLLIYLEMPRLLELLHCTMTCFNTELFIHVACYTWKLYTPFFTSLCLFTFYPFQSSSSISFFLYRILRHSFKCSPIMHLHILF
jgi:hypothetical protein